MQDASTPTPFDENADSAADDGQSAEFELADVAAFEQRTGRGEGGERTPRAAADDWLIEVDDTDYLAPLPGSPPARSSYADGDASASAGDDDSDDEDSDDSDDDDYVREPEEPVRLQKVLAAAGVGSRRKCEQLIVEGRVEVDGVVVRELGSRVRPDSAIIRVDGERLNLRSDLVYLAFNKPRGVLSTMADDKGRESIGTYLVDRKERLFHVGRLDADSEGLILLTNDGELAHRLTHPKYGVQKTYLAQVAAPVPRHLGRALMRGIELEDGLAKADDYQLLDVSGGRALIQIVLHEGRKHIVRRMLATAGFPVQQLVRTAHGPITLGHLRSGAVRKLSRSELAALYRLVGL
ncbi:MAG: pseudouridine synthase Rsu [Jatrophihabitantaceae bacterium]|nr:pseudouridine synthase Rsu [Jatrophihabitantaceae bacterium]